MAYTNHRELKNSIDNGSNTFSAEPLLGKDREHQIREQVLNRFFVNIQLYDGDVPNQVCPMASQLSW
jgi:hypothetical protein